MPHPRPMPRQLVSARRWRAHFRRKILRDVENLHDEYSSSQYWAVQY